MACHRLTNLIPLCRCWSRFKYICAADHSGQIAIRKYIIRLCCWIVFLVAAESRTRATASIAHDTASTSRRLRLRRNWLHRRIGSQSHFIHQVRYCSCTFVVYNSFWPFMSWSKETRATGWKSNEETAAIATCADLPVPRCAVTSVTIKSSACLAMICIIDTQNAWHTQERYVNTKQSPSAIPDGWNLLLQALDKKVVPNATSVRPPLPPKGEAAPPPLPPPRKNRKGPFTTPLLSRKDFSVNVGLLP